MRITGATALYVISVAAELAGMHPQTLRQYDRLGLVTPQRTSGRGRRYSAEDILRLQEVQRLSAEEGINLAGIKRIMELHDRVAEAEAARGELIDEVERLRERLGSDRRVFAAGAAGDVTALRRGTRPVVSPSGAIVLWNGSRRVMM